MPISRGSIHHTIAQDVLALGESYTHRDACKRPSSSVREKAENQIAQYFGSKHSILFPFARTCFYAILKSLNLPPGTEVLMTPFNISPMLHIIYSLGLKPRFIDINLYDFGPNYQELDAALSAKPGCFLLTYLFGSIPNISNIVELCKRYNVFLIEDISQAVGGTFNDKYLGTFGDAAIFSASITKFIDGYNGAFVLTDHDEIRQNMKYFMAKAIEPSPNRIRLIIARTCIWNIALSRIAFNLFTFPLLSLTRWLSRPTFDNLLGPSIKAEFRNPLPTFYFEDISSIQVTTILSQLAKLKALLKQRRHYASHLLNAFKNLKADGCESVIINEPPSIFSSTFWQFAVDVGSTKQAQDVLFEAGVETGITNLPDLSSMCGIESQNAKKLKTEFIFLPIHSHLNEAHYRQILRLIL